MASFLRESLPPKCDYITYLTIIESHLSPEILPTLNEILQDPDLTQNIGWDLIHLLLPIPNSVQCLKTIAKYGNPREVILKVTEALQILKPHSEQENVEKNMDAEPTDNQKFCLLIDLLSILHPRIKTKYPSRFLSTTLKSILATYYPSEPATIAIISFILAIFEKNNFSSLEKFSSIRLQDCDKKVKALAPDPEAQDEDPQEEKIQIKLVQSFVTHVIEKYISENPLDWAPRLLEHLHPKKVIERRSIEKAFREDPVLHAREKIVGQLMDISQDFGLMQHDTLFAVFVKENPLVEQEFQESDDFLDNLPTSSAGSLLIAANSIFASIKLKSQLPLPQLTIFPDHVRLVKIFIEAQGSDLIAGKLLGVIDAILLLGLWLESENKFVSGPLDDEEFLKYLQWLSYLSTITPSSSLRSAAHILSSSILHAHPIDRLRLTFISDTLENCPYESLKASAVSWLKEELIIASERNTNNVFTSTTALVATQPFLFPATLGMLDASDKELIDEVNNSFPFHMAVLNFLVLLCGNKYHHILPTTMLNVAEEIYVRPLKTVCKKLLDMRFNNPKLESEITKMELQLLEERLNLCLTELARANRLEDKN
ncbi:hypothetical protein HI914_01434 [Erysiphe necator]|nr:hypothetical protein HI914_01434 [Erysiphe necator]